MEILALMQAGRTKGERGAGQNADPGDAIISTLIGRLLSKRESAHLFLGAGGFSDSSAAQPLLSPAFVSSTTGR